MEEITNHLFSIKQLVRENHIDKFIYCGEIAGDCDIETENPNGRLDCHILILMDKGEMTLSTSEQKKKFSSPCILSVAGQTPICKVRCSKSFHAFATGIEMNLLLDILRNRNPFPANIRSLFRISDGFRVNNPEKMKRLLGDCRHLLSALGDKSHHFLEELNYAHLYILLTDFADIVWDNEIGRSPEHTKKMSRGDTLLLDFMEALAGNIEKETSVDFYAGKLFISRQHLAAIVFRKTGLGVGKVISTFRYEHAMKYVLDPTLSIKQIADIMSFPDQSAFGKFFRKYNGLSPATYRKNIKISLLSGRETSPKLK